MQFWHACTTSKQTTSNLFFSFLPQLLLLHLVNRVCEAAILIFAEICLQILQILDFACCHQFLIKSSGRFSLRPPVKNWNHHRHCSSVNNDQLQRLFSIWRKANSLIDLSKDITVADKWQLFLSSHLHFHSGHKINHFHSGHKIRGKILLSLSLVQRHHSGKLSQQFFPQFAFLILAKYVNVADTYKWQI